MAWTDGLVDLMPSSVSVAEWTGLSTDGYAVPAYSTSPTTYSARIVTQQRLVRSFEGTEELATTTVWVASTSTFDARDQWTVNGDTPVLLAIETFRDESGITHSKLAFG